MTLPRGRAGLAAAAVLVTLVLGGSPAAAESLVIRKIDTTEFPAVVVSVLHTGSGITPNVFALRENGRIISDVEVVPIGKTATPVGIALVIDTSGSMRGANLDAAKQAARDFVARKQPNEQITVVAFSDVPRIVVNFTADSDLVNAAIDGLEARGETALWDAVRLGSGLFSERPELLANMVVLSDGADTVSQAPPESALGAALAEEVAVFAVGLNGGGEFDRAGLEQLAAATSGAYVETTDRGQVGLLYEGVQRQIQNQFEITYSSPANTPEVEIAVTATGMTVTATAATGTVTGGKAPRVVVPPSVPFPLRSGYGLAIVAALVALAAATLAVGVVNIIRRDRAILDDALSPYFGVTAPEVAGERAERNLAQTAIVRRAVVFSTRFATERGLIALIEKRLEQADLRLRAQEALFFFVAMVVVVTVGLGVGLGPLAGLAAFAVVGLGPVALMNFLAGRRQRAFSGQLPDTLQLLASSLRAGYSLQQGVETVAREVSGPMGRELRRVVIESTLARPLDEALGDSAARMESPDFDWAVIAIRIQREVGGNLAELLTTVSETMIARDRLRREVRALTAEGRFSAIILLALPVVLGGVIFVLNPTYMQPLFGTTLGQVMVGGAGVLAGLGFVWMRKIVEIKA
jgi:tight adherence protein B